MPAVNTLTLWFSQLDRRSYAIVVGLSIGITGAAIGLLIAGVGPLLALAAICGLLAGLYIITDVNIALYSIIATVVVLPFGIFPVKIAVTPTLLDLALAGFLLVYVFQWMTGRRGGFQLTPVHALVAVYLMWLIFAFVLGPAPRRPHLFNHPPIRRDTPQYRPGIHT